MLIFWIVVILIINAIAVLSEDRFLARGMSPSAKIYESDKSNTCPIYSWMGTHTSGARLRRDIR